MTTAFLTTATSPPLSRAFYQRLIGFQAGQPKVLGYVSPIWAGLEKYHAGLERDLQRADVVGVASSLSDIYSNDSLAGVDGPNGGWSLGDWEQECIATAQCLGVLPVFNPWQPNSLTALEAEKVITGIEVNLGGVLTHPGGGGMQTANVNGRLISMKLLEAVRWFVSVRRLLPAGGRVLEIGAGCGYLGFLLRQFMPASRYHTIDLPVVSVMQAYLLAGAVGENVIWLAGESPNPDARIFIHGLAGPVEALDVVVNVNSFPEIPVEMQDFYLNFVGAWLKRGCCFLSINHESNSGGQRRVFEAATIELQLLSRTPAWGRTGYVQELWQR